MLPGAVAGQRMAVLCFRNVSQGPLRFLLPRPAFFRGTKSWLALEQGPARVIEPESPPHGYHLDERDFHLLEPGQGVAFWQRIHLAGLVASRPIDVQWTCENSARRWEGGVETLDGPTSPLFGGEDVPFLWLGRLSTRLTWTPEG